MQNQHHESGGRDQERNRRMVGWLGWIERWRMLQVAHPMNNEAHYQMLRESSAPEKIDVLRTHRYVIRNLPERFNDWDLAKMLLKFGPVYDAYVAIGWIKQPNRVYSKRYAFVIMHKIEDARYSFEEFGKRRRVCWASNRRCDRRPQPRIKRSMEGKWAFTNQLFAEYLNLTLTRRFGSFMNGMNQNQNWDSQTLDEILWQVESHLFPGLPPAMENNEMNTEPEEEQEGEGGASDESDESEERKDQNYMDTEPEEEQEEECGASDKPEDRKEQDEMDTKLENTTTRRRNRILNVRPLIRQINNHLQLDPSTSSGSDTAPRTLRVTKLPDQFGDSELESMFENFGVVLEAEMQFDERGFKTRNGFVTMERATDARKALDQLNKSKANCLDVEVFWATAEERAIRTTSLIMKRRKERESDYQADIDDLIRDTKTLETNERALKNDLETTILFVEQLKKNLEEEKEKHKRWRRKAMDLRNLLFAETFYAAGDLLNDLVIDLLEEDQGIQQESITEDSIVHDEPSNEQPKEALLIDIDAPVEVEPSLAADLGDMKSWTSILHNEIDLMGLDLNSVRVSDGEAPISSQVLYDHGIVIGLMENSLVKIWMLGKHRETLMSDSTCLPVGDIIHIRYELDLFDSPVNVKLSGDLYDKPVIIDTKSGLKVTIPVNPENVENSDKGRFIRDRYLGIIEYDEAIMDEVISTVKVECFYSELEQMWKIERIKPNEQLKGY